MMRKRREKPNFHTLLCILAVLVFISILPVQALALEMAYGDWELDGFIRNNTGIWTEDFDYAPNDDPLATFRNWFRLNLNGKLSDSLRLKAEVLAVWEPEYPRESHCLNKSLNTIKANEYNSINWRELRLDWRPAMGHEIRVGRQIVNWGESISVRVGDVINPEDKTFSLAFTNLEDTRMPIWMARGLHQFLNIGTTLDWIVSPYMEPDRYRTDLTVVPPFMELWSDGTRNPLLDAFAGFEVQGGNRFAHYPEFRLRRDGKRIPHSQIHSLNPFLNPTDPSTWYLKGGPIFYPPMNSLYTHYNAGDVTPIGLPIFEDGYYLLDYTSAFDQRITYPGSSLSDSRWGFKTSSTFMGTQTGIYFFHRHQFEPPTYKEPADHDGDGVKEGYSFTVKYDEPVDYYGYYANKSFDFGVLRTDIAYIPDFRANTHDFTNYPNGVVTIDRLLFQLGYNKDFMFSPLNENQAFSLICEYAGNYILEDPKGAIVALTAYTPMYKDDHTFMASIGTNYNFGTYEPNLTVIYNVRNAGVIKPSFTYVPDWMDRKWSFTLQYNMVFGDKLETIYGLLTEKDMLILTSQFSF